MKFSLIEKITRSLLSKINVLGLDLSMTNLVSFLILAHLILVFFLTAVIQAKNYISSNWQAVVEYFKINFLYLEIINIYILFGFIIIFGITYIYISYKKNFSFNELKKIFNYILFLGVTGCMMVTFVTSKFYVEIYKPVILMRIYMLVLVLFLFFINYKLEKFNKILAIFVQLLLIILLIVSNRTNIETKIMPIIFTSSWLENLVIFSAVLLLIIVFLIIKFHISKYFGNLNLQFRDLYFEEELLLREKNSPMLNKISFIKDLFALYVVKYTSIDPLKTDKENFLMLLNIFFVFSILTVYLIWTNNFVLAIVIAGNLYLIDSNFEKVMRNYQGSPAYVKYYQRNVKEINFFLSKVLSSQNWLTKKTKPMTRQYTIGTETGTSFFQFDTPHGYRIRTVFQNPSHRSIAILSVTVVGVGLISFGGYVHSVNQNAKMQMHAISENASMQIKMHQESEMTKRAQMDLEKVKTQLEIERAKTRQSWIKRIMNNN